VRRLIKESWLQNQTLGQKAYVVLRLCQKIGDTHSRSKDPGVVSSTMNTLFVVFCFAACFSLITGKRTSSIKVIIVLGENEIRILLYNRDEGKNSIYN
jgi:hypothetical protein